MKHQTHSEYDLFKKHSRLFRMLQIKHGGGCHTQRNTQTNSAPSSGMWKTRGPIHWILGERDETEKTRNDIDVHVCVCSFIIMFVCARFYCLFFPACLFIHLPLCLRICQSRCVRRASVLNLDSICRVFSVQGLFSSPLAWKVFLCLTLSASSAKPNYPKYCEIS